MAEKPRVGVLGAGYWGKNLVRNFAALGVLSAVADPDDAVRARLAAEHPHVRSYTDGFDLLEREEVEAVAIATPASTHGDLVRAGLAHGKHVFVEKPLCLDLAEAIELKHESDELGLTLMVGHVLLYHPAFVALKDLVAAGGLGPLRYIYSNRLSLGKIRREENALWSFAPHDISMILQLTGMLPTTVTAVGGHYLTPGVADTTLTHMRFSEDVQAHIFVSWLHPYKDHRLVVVGEDAMIAFNDVAEETDKLLLYRHEVAWQGSVPIVTKATPQRIRHGDEEPLRVECETFLRAIIDGGRPLSDADEGIRVLTVLEACQTALVNGERVHVESVPL